MAKYNMFCYICKAYIPIVAKDKKEAHTEFRRSGHSDDKVTRLRRNIVIGK